MWQLSFTAGEPNPATRPASTRSLEASRDDSASAVSRGSLLATSVGMLAHFKVPLSWKDLAVRTAQEIWADDLLNLAAQQAYYFFFALFPALLTFISFASFFPIHDLTG